jgi:hypothetical protein
MEGYNKTVWFSNRAITNIIVLRNLIDHYRVTYDSDDLMFVVHRESESKPNMEFNMHKSGLHYYDPTKENHLTFVNTVLENKTGFTKRQIKCAEIARNLYKTLSYPSMNDFKWVIRSNQIKDCPLTIQDIDVATNIWGKNIAAPKGKTTRSKTHPVARDYVKVSKELLKLHKEVFLTTDIFLVNKIPFFLTLSRKIFFTAVNHLVVRTVPQIFKAFKEMYQYYLQRGFHITTVSYARWTHGQLCQCQRARTRNRTPDVGSEGVMPSDSTQPPVSHNPQDHDYPHCTKCHQAVDFFSNERGSF